MKNKLKKLGITLFVISVIAFFTGLSVILIIIAQGGKVTPEGIEHTGIIRLNAEPERGIDVYVDNQKVSLQDKRIEDLDEGTYEIRVEKEGYSPWVKDVTVEEGIVKEVYVTLFPVEYELEQITQTNIDQAFFSPDGTHVVYVVTNSEKDIENGIWKLKLTQNAFGLISNNPERLQAYTDSLKEYLDEPYSIEIAYDNSKLLLEGENYQVVLGMDTNTSNIRDLSSIENIGFMADKIQWFNNGDSLIIEKDNSIFEYDYSDNILRHIYKFETTPVYAVNGDKVIFVANETYYQYTNNQKNILETHIQVPLPIAEKLWLSPYDDELLYIKTNDMLYFANLDKSLHKIGQYNLLELSPKGQAAVLLDVDSQVSIFRNTFEPGRNQVITNINKLNINYDPDTCYFLWSTDGQHLIHRRQVDQDNDKTLKLIDIYGANEYEILESAQIVNGTYQLINESSEFVVLLNDSEVTNEANLHRIKLR